MSAPMLDVLAHCCEFRTFSSGPHYAARLASALDASFTGLYVVAPIPLLPSIGIPPALLDEYLACAHEEIARAEQAQQAFVHWATGQGAHSNHWQLALGQLPEVVAAAGNHSDFIVVEQRARSSRGCLNAIGDALLGGVTCIVVPQNSESPPAWDRVAIAWNGSQETIRAVQASLPILRMAKQIYVLFTPAAPKHSRVICEPEPSLEAYLRRHRVNAHYEALDLRQRSPAQAILLASTAVAADLLITGAFGTTRFRTDDRSGITCNLIEQSRIPLLLRH